ncbi:MAG: radical SAM protein [archaeon]
MASSSTQVQLQETQLRGAVPLYRTESLCSKCFGKVSGEISEENGRIFLEKDCVPCGVHERCLVENDADFFRRTIDSFPPESDPAQARVEDLGKVSSHAIGFFVTPRCNANCSVCIARDFMCESSITRKKQLTVAEIKSVIERASLRGKEILLVGGEPTIHKDFLEIVETFRESGNFVVLYTNGKRLASRPFVKKMKAARISLVNLSFDSLNGSAYVKMKGKNLLKAKLSAFENLRAEGIPTCLVATIAKGVNDGEVSGILDFAAKNGAARVMFHPMKPYGKLKIKHDWLLTSSDIIKLLEAQTEGRVKSSDFESLLRTRRLALDCIERLFGRDAARKFAWGRGYSILLKVDEKGFYTPLFTESFLNSVSKGLEGFLKGRNGMTALISAFPILFENENRKVLVSLLGSGFDRIAGIYKSLDRRDMLQLHIADISTQHNVDYSRQVDVYEYSKTPEGRELLGHTYPT